ncbi:MAG: NUDIX domain-containing protein [Alphaproteobacteria bacterium]|nr:NUDIX domain-containing protein [Alphaproteobacteria bacterium]
MNDSSSPDGEPSAAHESDPSSPGRRRKRRRTRGPRRGACPPDILYHATTRDRAERARTRGVLEVGGGRPVFLSRTEAQAWQVAHRQPGEPMVLYIDAARARQLRRCRFERNRQGLWQAGSVPVGHVLNLRPGFAEQASAGGIPIFFGPRGPELLMIQVARRHRQTWEVAKGKLEPGESPEAAAIREVREEMGLPVDLEIIEHLGYVRYGFTTPDREPRLKTLHMYLMRAEERFTEFHPADAEGIKDVAWFTPDEAARLVAHRSLRPLVRRVCGRLKRGVVDENGLEWNPVPGDEAAEDGYCDD